MRPYRITHVTHYRYRAPVRLGPHRLMLRPRDSHVIRLRETALAITPEPSDVRWLLDVYGNSIAIASFAGEATELRIESRIELEHYGLDDPDLVAEPLAQRWPFTYAPAEAPDLAPYLARHWPDPAALVNRWALRFVREHEDVATAELLVGMARAIKDSLPYRARDEEGTQPPLVTLEQGGTCRDFAALMMEALRTLGIAARFVSGYLYSPALDPSVSDGKPAVGAGATHAWVDAYVPGAGWVEFDPTNALFGGKDLIRVCVARAPELASPIVGAFAGPADAALPLEVTVTVDWL